MLAGIQHGMMFDGRTDDVIAGPDQAGDGEIVSLSATAGEDDLEARQPSRAATDSRARSTAARVSCP